MELDSASAFIWEAEALVSVVLTLSKKPGEAGFSTASRAPCPCWAGGVFRSFH